MFLATIKRDDRYHAGPTTLPSTTTCDCSLSKKDANQDKKLFMQYVDKMGLTMTWRQDSISQQDNVFLVDSKSEVAGIIKLHEDQVKRDTFERLQTRLQAHVDVIQRSLARKAETRKEMELMKLVSFLVPFLMGMRRRNKIPDIEKLLPPPLPADDCKTERELPPLMLSPDFRCPNFDFGNKYFHLHGGIQVDIESDDVRDLPRTSGPSQPLWVHAFYEKIKDLKPKRLPLADNQMHEQFKKRYNYKQAIKYKSAPSQLGKQDEDGYSLAHYAALYNRPQILQLLIGQGQDLNVRRFHLTSSVEMLNSESFKKRDSAVRSLEILTTSSLQHSNSILKANGIPALVNIMKLKHQEMQSLGAAVLCNMAKENESVCLAIAASGAIPILICLLGSVTDDIQSRVAIILADLARFEDNRSAIASQGGIPPLIHLLDSELEDVLVNAVNAIRVICLGNQDNQTLVAKHGGIEPLTEFLETDSDLLQAASAAALAAITHNHKQNQDLAIDAAKPLVGLLKLRNMEVQVKAAAALESLAESNPHSQEAILALDAPTHLIRLLKVRKIVCVLQGSTFTNNYEGCGSSFCLRL
ncbi:putative ankyrin and armadillo repeat-containing protein [Apostichopus japonicus]|uniref:Putative ankyrin and armadillo repeat-containing protein n=1 Tax=Stichopus japonicus TaxID=307972 RepID=A0A2G8JZT4_STIJA|nr:putative ankyrin and armadillo repeat-containing protein [Apostichopus japonicus]